MNLTKAKVKKLAVDPVVIDLVASALVAEAKKDHVKSVVDAYLKPVFESFSFYVSDKWGESKRDFSGTDGIDDTGKITDVDSIYLTDLKSDNYKSYENEVRNAHLAGPFASVVLEYEKKHNGDKGWCPALIAETALRNANNKLAKHVATKWVGLEDINYPHTEKLNKIVIGLVLNGPAGESLKCDVPVGFHSAA